MQRKVMISCAVTGRRTRRASIRRAGHARPDRHLGDRCRQGGCGDRAHPRARSKDDAGEHGARPVRRGGGPDPPGRHGRGDQPDDRPGARSPPTRATHETRPGRRAPARQRVRHVLDLRPEICSPRHGQPEHRRAASSSTRRRLKVIGDRHPRGRREARARGLRDRAPALAKRMIETGHINGADLPDRPRRRLGPAGNDRDHELDAHLAAAGRDLAAFGFGRASSRWPRRRCCSAATCASASRTISFSNAASRRRAMPRWSTRRRDLRILGSS